MNLALRYILIVVFSLIGYGNSYAQTLEEIREQADEFFEQEDYKSGISPYLKIISADIKNAKNHDLSFRYGTCLLYGTGAQKKEAIARLSYSIKNPSIDKRAYYFLAKAYHLNFQFDLAIKYYTKFKEVGSTSDIKKYNVDVAIQACNNGKRLLTNVTDMIVIQKTEIKEEDFYELYKLDDIGGTILVYDQFQSKYDKKMGHRPVIHFPKNSPYIYFSSYGEDGSTGLDIYVVKKLPDGKWSLAQKVIGGVNTFEDDNYPYMNPNGNYLYFSSKGHNSMGGYDVFRSRYNPDDNSFSTPENMDFAISSPDDDILYIVDSLDRIAYFSSNRESEDGKMTVYNVRVEKIPMQMAVIKGDFINSLEANNKKIEIVVSDYSNGAVIGTYNSKSKNGEFLLTFPKSGKYTFIMTVDGQEVSHQAVITIPNQKEFRPLKMKITHSKDGINEPQLVVEQLFDEYFENPSAIMAEVYKDLSVLSPNSRDYDLDSLDKMHATDEIFVDAGLDPYATQDDVEKVVEDKIEDIEELIAENEKNSNIAYHLAEEKIEEAELKINEANDLITQANNETDPAKKADLFEQAYLKNEEAKTLKEEADKYVALAQKIDEDTNQKNGELATAKKTLIDIKSVEDKDRLGLTTAIENNQTFFDSQIKNSNTSTIIEDVTSQGNQRNKNISTLNDDIVNLKADKLKLEEENKNLAINLGNAKKNKEKERIQKIINANESELDVINSTIAAKQTKLDGLTSSTDIDLSKTASSVVDPSRQTETYTKAIHPNDKNKISNRINNSTVDSSIQKVDQVLADNNVAGRYVSLTGFDESRTDFTDKEFEVAIDNEIKAQTNLLANTTDPTEKEKIQGEIARLNKVKENRVGEGTAATANKGEVNEWDIIPDYKAQQEKINQITDEKDRRIEQNKLNESVISSANIEKTKVEEALKNDPNNVALQNRLENINKIIGVATKNIDDNNNWLNGSVATATTNTNYSTVIGVATPNYSDRVNAIQSSTATAAEKENQIKNLNQTALANTEERIQEVKAVLETEPNNASANAELEQLNKIKSDLEENPNKSLLTPSGIDDMSSVEAKVTRDDVLPNYSTQIENIENSTNSELQKEKEKLAINKTLLDRINKQIEEINTEIESNPENEKTLKKRIKSLNSQKEDVEADIQSSEVYIKANPISEGIDENLVANVNDVNPDFESEKTRINQLEDETEKDLATKELNNTTIAKIDTQIQEANTILSENPSDIEVQQKVVELNNLKNQLAKENTEIDNKSGSDSNQDFTTVSPTISLDKFMPSYNSDMANISNSADPEMQQEQDKIGLNRTLISNIDKELAGLNSYLETNPSNAKDVEKRIKNLNTIKAAKEEEIKISQDIIDANPEMSSTATGLVSVEQINPNYVTEMVQIEKIEDDSKKEEEIQNLNTRTIGMVDSKIDELENTLAANPSDDQLSKQISELKTLKTNLESNLDEAQDQNELTRRYGDISTNPSENELLATYDNNLATINGSPETEETKAQLKINLNTELIAEIDNELAGLKSYLATNPTNSKDVEKRIKNLESLKADKIKENNSHQAIIDANPEAVSVNGGAVTIEQINPAYVAEMEEIEKIEDDAQKTKEIQNLNRSTIELIDNKLNQLETDLAANPDDQELSKQIDGLTNLKANLSSNLDEANDKNELARRYGNVPTNPTENELLSTHDNRLATINGSTESEETKAQQKINLNTELIAKIDNELEGLKSYLATMPTNSKDVEKRIKNLESLKADKNKENEVNQIIIDQKKVVGTISIGELMPNYESKSNSIDNNSMTEAEKLDAKTELNNDLIKQIDSKIAELNNMKTAQPDKAEEIEEQIQKLNELKEVKLNENARNNELAESINSTSSNTANKSVDDVADLNESNFTTDEGKEEFNNMKESFDELDNISNEIDDLESDKEKAQTDKEKTKLDKQIEKKTTEKAKIENEIIEDLNGVNSKEIRVKNAQVVNESTNAKSEGIVNSEIKQADEQVNLANSKIKEAKLLRVEAEQEKDPILANNKLKRAIVLETEAKDLLEKANVTYKTAIVVNNLNSNSPEIITEVPTNNADKKSTAMFNEAEKMNQQANYYENRAVELRDSAETVKKKYKQAVLIQAQENEDKANSTRVKADQLTEKATAVKNQEDELIAALPSNSAKTVTEEDKEDIITTDTYKEYYNSKTAGDQDLAKANAIGEQIANLKTNSGRKIKMAVVVGGSQEEIANDAEIKKIQDEIDSLTRVQEEYKNSAIQNYNNANRTIENSDLSQDSKDNIAAMANNNEKPKDKVVIENPLLADFTPPGKLNQDIFRTTDVPVYNSTKDIPVDAQQPEGLVYKVQIGAFRKEPSQTYFEKFAPVSGQSLDNGITRYMVGYFTNFTPANEAKNKVRGMGDYKDAFVVAYYNGKRISIAEARELEKNQPLKTDPTEFVTTEGTTEVTTEGTTEGTTDVNPEVSNITTETDGSVSVVPVSNDDKIATSYYTNTPGAAKANQVEIMKGLFFTVQIGVYSKPVPAAALFNTTPLNSQLTESGKVRYTTGIYNSVADASERKSAVVGSGISDAFVTAYYNGKRITVAEARSILNQKGESALFLNGVTESAGVVEEGGQDPVVEEKDTTSTSSTVETPELNTTLYEKENVYYRILIGKFEGRVPNEYAAYLFNTDGVIFETETDWEDNIYLYTTKQRSMDKVREHLVELHELGIEDMQLVTYYNLEIIPFEQGQNIIKGKQNERIEPLEFPEGINADYLLYNAEAVYYRVELGSFEEKIPAEFAELLIQLPEEDIYHEDDIDGKEEYYSVSFQSVEEAQTKLEEYKNMGFADVKVVAYHKYKKISVKKALEIKGK